ncbi:MAG: YceI family protein [Janthinobacterium lividum]
MHQSASKSFLEDIRPQLFNGKPGHTFPSFEADRFGISNWRGKSNKTSGKLMLDKQARTGSVDITIDMALADFGFPAMNKAAASGEQFDMKKYSKAACKSTAFKFEDDRLVAVEGDFTLRGVTRPLTLTVSKFGCVPDRKPSASVAAPTPAPNSTAVISGSGCSVPHGRLDDLYAAIVEYL